MNVVPFPTPAGPSELERSEAILTGFTRLLTDIQTQQKRLIGCGFCPEVRNAMLLDLANASLRLFDANIRFLNEIKRDLPNEAEAI